MLFQCVLGIPFWDQKLAISEGDYVNSNRLIDDQSDDFCKLFWTDRPKNGIFSFAAVVVVSPSSFSSLLTKH